jgi:hypothetical protein
VTRRDVLRRGRVLESGIVSLDEAVDALGQMSSTTTTTTTHVPSVADAHTAAANQHELSPSRDTTTVISLPMTPPMDKRTMRTRLIEMGFNAERVDMCALCVRCVCV